jgi:endonuclease G
MTRTQRNILAFCIGLVLGGVAAVAFANPIDDACPQHVVWGAPQVKQEGYNQYLCRTGYAVNYNYQTKVAHFAVEHVKKEALVKSAARKDDFREDPEVPVQFRSTLADYKGAGYDRGHIAPAADMTYSAIAMSESFYLTNMMPQDPGNNRGIWKYTEEYVRFWADAYGEVYVISGPYYSGQANKVIGNNVRVPDYVWKIVIDPQRSRAITFIFPNQKLDPKQLDNYISTISEVEHLTGINISPMLPQQLQGMKNIRANMKDW